ncbi:MAG: DUF2911 domain-containing protein [Bacteroidia bacterium]|nr:DUF2911 domain-containing protein [Bacteroidia bacterium]
MKTNNIKTQGAITKMQTSRISRSLVILFLTLVITIPCATAQWRIELPVFVSPRATVSQTFGTTDVSVEYSRPSVKSRAIWGDLVPYGEVWRAGANANTVVRLEHDVAIMGDTLKAGSYGLHMIPNEKEWTVIFSNDFEAWGSYAYAKEQDALRVTVSPELVEDHQEQLQYYFDNVEISKGELILHWAKLRIVIPMEVNVERNTILGFKERLQDLEDTTLLWDDFYLAASYCVRRKSNQDQAYQWNERSILLDSNFDNLYLKSIFLMRMDQKDEASRVEAVSFERADEEQLNNLGLGLIRSKKSEKAVRILNYTATRYPDSWKVHYNLGLAYSAHGDKKKALKKLRLALKLASKDDTDKINDKIEEIRSS